MSKRGVLRKTGSSVTYDAILADVVKPLESARRTSSKDAAVARYALDDLPNQVLAAEYRMRLPDEKILAAELARTRRRLEARRPAVARPRRAGR